MNNEPDYDNLYFEENKMTMQDRLRFRAWYKDYYIYDIQLVGADWSVSKQCNEDCFGDFFYNEYCVIEQCTGLKDKNGKLIYEGDIVKLSSDREVVCPVVWDNEETGFCVKYKKELYRFNTYKKYHLIEVIGNIHENADLLEVGGK